MTGGYLSARRTHDGFMTISLIANSEFRGLCRVLECPELLEDARFSELSGRLQHSDELGEILDSLTSKLGNAELSERLAAADVPHAPVNRLESLHEDPQVIANGTLVELDHPVSGRSRSPRPVAEFSATPAEIRHAAPELGVDGTKLLAELGLGQAEIAVLRERGILG